MSFKFIKKANITLPLFKWTNNVEKYFKITSEILQGKPLAGEVAKAMSEGKPMKEPAYLCNVTDLETGEHGQIIVATVLRSTLNDHYPDKKYIGKCFALEQYRDVKKDYNTYQVTEIEIDETPTTPAVK